MRRFYKVMVIALLLAVTLYVSSYLYLSRRGFAEARQYGFVGFYFFPPEDTPKWHFTERACGIIYFPLITVDNWLGTGMPVGGCLFFTLAPPPPGQADDPAEEKGQ